MLVRLLVAVCWFSSFAASSIWAAPASPKHGDVPLSQCAVVFERFSHIRLPADTKAMSRALQAFGLRELSITDRGDGEHPWTVQGVIISSVATFAVAHRVEEFVRIAAQHDALFDGWGTPLDELPPTI